MVHSVVSWRTTGRCSGTDCCRASERRSVASLMSNDDRPVAAAPSTDTAALSKRHTPVGRDHGALSRSGSRVLLHSRVR